VVLGVIAMTAVLAVMAMSSTPIAIGAVVAVCVGAATAVAARRVERWRIEAKRWRASRARAVEAGRFDVVSDEPARRAAHLLARWWNHRAQPVSASRLWSAVPERRDNPSELAADGPRPVAAPTRARTSDASPARRPDRPTRVRPGGAWAISR
jgi:hypothetical protein